MRTGGTSGARATPAELSRELGVRQATAIVVGTIIGSGIFLVPAEMMQAVGSARLVYAAWIVGGLLSFFGALTYAELGALKPEAGGEYVYVRDAYGPMAGFLYAWTYFLIAKPASIATVTTGVVRILGTFSIFSFFADPVFGSGPSVTYGQLTAMMIAALISFVNYLGIRKAGELQVAITVLKVAMILGIVALGFSYPAGSWSHFAGSFGGAQGGMAGFMAALVAALWAYDGWNDLNMVAGEVRSPGKSLPVALIAGLAAVGSLYMLTNAAVQYVLPPEAIAASARPASDAIQLVLGSAGAKLVAAGMALSMMATLNGTIMSGARVPFAVARDGYFFAGLARVDRRFRTPGIALLVQAGLAVVLLLLGGSFRQFFSLALFAEWLFYMIAASTVFVFRSRNASANHAYRVWGYPVVPAMFVMAAAVLLFYTFRDNLRNSAAGTVVILAGIPVFWWFSRKRAAVS